MNIILEGADGAGKTTLGNFLSENLNLPLILGEGPEKYNGEINDRIRRYLKFDNVIFDRHPCISHPIYSLFTLKSDIDPTLLKNFYNSKPVIIYCVATSLDDHKVEQHDTEEHLTLVKQNYLEIKVQYHKWAAQHAHIWFRREDSMNRVLNMVKGLV